MVSDDGTGYRRSIMMLEGEISTPYPVWYGFGVKSGRDNLDGTDVNFHFNVGV